MSCPRNSKLGSDVQAWVFISEHLRPNFVIFPIISSFFKDCYEVLRVIFYDYCFSQQERVCKLTSHNNKNKDSVDSNKCTYGPTAS